jgi:hypothetical protein
MTVVETYKRTPYETQNTVKHLPNYIQIVITYLAHVIYIKSYLVPFYRTKRSNVTSQKHGKQFTAE